MLKRSFENFIIKLNIIKMNTSSSIFKFVTIRNASNIVTSEHALEIQPQTEIIATLVKILSNNKSQTDKIKQFNQCLDDFIKSKNFYKTKQELADNADKFLSTKKEKKDGSEIKNFYYNLYDNIVIRTITKSNTNEVFKLLTDSIKVVFQKINSETVRAEDIQKIKIILPEGLIISFSPPTVERAITENPSSKDLSLILNQIQDLHVQKEQILKSKEDNSIKIRTEQQRIFKLQNVNAKDDLQANNKTKTPQKKSAPKIPATQTKAIPTDVIDKLFVDSKNLQEAEAEINHNLTILNTDVFQLFPQTSYARIGEKWVDVPQVDLNPTPPEPDNESIVVYSHGCYLKFPFQVADLRVVEQKTVGYLPNEIAHINNTQPGEKQEKVTRRLKRIETFESLITEDELSKETDTQSTEKFSLEKSASEVQSEENSINVNASVSGTYGVTTASLDTGFSHSDSSENSNSSSQSYAKEIVQKVVDKVSHKVKSERSIKSIEEFEETVTHIIDNTGGTSGSVNIGPKSYVYRWLTKLVRATLKNYGKRLMFQIDVAHPSNYYLSRILKEGVKINIPPDPRKWNKNSSDPIIRDFYSKNPTFPFYFNIDSIARENYLALAVLYKTKLDMPPMEDITVSAGFAATADGARAVGEIVIPPGYYCVKGRARGLSREPMFVTISTSDRRSSVWPANYLYDNENNFTINPRITDKFHVSFLGGAYTVNFEIECKLTTEAFNAWQIKCYQAIIEAYENLNAEAESKMSVFNPNNPGINPSRKTELIKTELKKGALQKMFRCNPFWIKDNYQVGDEYDPDCCKDNLNAEKVRFLENVFDWKNMTYELHPYFYTNHNKLIPTADNWSKLLNLTDDDPHFEAFLQSSYATVRIPVYRDSEKEIAAINFILNNSIANYSVVPDSMQHILDDLKVNTPFGYIDETETEIPFVSIQKEYDRTRQVKIYYLDDTNTEVVCNEFLEYDKEGNHTIFYYNASTSQVVISEIKEGVNSDGQKYNYYFNSANEKIITHKTKTEYDIDGNSTPYYSIDLGIFPIPTDLVILEAGVQDGVELRGYPEDQTEPTSEVIIPQQYSPAIIKKNPIV